MQELSPSSPPALKKLPRALLPFLAPNRIDVKEFVLISHANSVPINRTPNKRLTYGLIEGLRKEGEYFLLCPKGEIQHIFKVNKKTHINPLPPLLAVPDQDGLTQDVLCQGEEEIKQQIPALKDGIYFLHGRYCSLPVMKLDGVWYPRDVDLSMEIAQRDTPSNPW
jgi:hypothetical protein